MKDESVITKPIVKRSLYSAEDWLTSLDFSSSTNTINDDTNNDLVPLKKSFYFLHWNNKFTKLIIYLINLYIFNGKSTFDYPII